MESSTAKITAGLVHFRRLYGHTNVPSRFRAPAGDGWPEDVWGYALGQAIAHARHLGNAERLPDAKRAALNRAGVVWDVYEWRWTHEVLPALRRWVDIHGADDPPPRSAVVPDGADDERWAGIRATGLRIGLYFRQVQQRHKSVPAWVFDEVAALDLHVPEQTAPRGRPPLSSKGQSSNNGGGGSRKRSVAAKRA